MSEQQYAARREAVARYLAREYEQTIEAARVRASEVLALIYEPDPFAPGTRVEVHETDGGYLVFPADDEPAVVEERMANYEIESARLAHHSAESQP